MTVSLLTNGWICYKGVTIVKKYILPLDIVIKDRNLISLAIINKNCLSLNMDNIIDKNVNLKLDENQINIKTQSNSINLKQN